MLVHDTDLLTILFRGPAKERARLLDGLDATGEQASATIISFEEQMRGWLSVVAQAKTVEHQVAAYSRLGELMTTFGRIPSCRSTELLLDVLHNCDGVSDAMAMPT